MLARLFAWWFEKTNHPVSPYQEAIARWMQSPSPDHWVYSEIRVIEVVYPTIDSYAQELLRLTGALERNLFYSLISEITPREVSVRDFYMSQTNFHLDVIYHHELLRRAAIDLLSVYERRALEENKSGLLQSTLYRGLPLLNNVITLSGALNP